MNELKAPISDAPGGTRELLWVLAFALAVRLLALWLGWESLAEDPDSYRRLALNLQSTGTYGFEARGIGQLNAEAVASQVLHGDVRPTAYRPPLYPWLLSWLAHDGRLLLLPLACLHLAMGMATVGLTYGIARRLVRIAWLPAVAMAVDPLLVRHSQLVMTETLATLAAVGCWWCWLRLYGHPQSPARAQRVADRSLSHLFCALILGVLFGLSILTRPTMAPWAALCVLGIVIVPWLVPCAELRWRIRFGDAATISLGIALCVAPWMLRNLSVLGQPIWATTHGGYTLLLANNPLLYEHFRRSGPSRGWNAEPFHRAWASRSGSPVSPTQPEFWSPERAAANGAPPLDELKDNALAYASAKATIARQPDMFWLASLYRVGWLWVPWPYSPAFSISMICIGMWYSLWYALAAVRIICGSRSARSEHARTAAPASPVAAAKPSRWRYSLASLVRLDWLPGLALALSLTAVHAVYWSNMRMRSPAMCVVYLAAMPRRRSA